MKNPKRQKASKHEDDVDLISNMPDHILLLILSRIRSTEEVIRTSILSKRWRHLWTAIPSLYISCREICCGQKSTKNEFKEFVYWILSNRTADLDSFSLRWSNNYFMSTVWRWIHMAVTRNVKEVDLSLWKMRKETESIELPHCLVSCGSLEVLRFSLMNCRVRLPKFVGFPALRVLDLTDTYLVEDGDLVNFCLKSFPLLEDLSLIRCVIGQLVCISCPKLKRLTIVNWDDVSCHDIKLSCPELAILDIGVRISEEIWDPVMFLENSHFKPLWTHLYFSYEALSNMKTLVLNAYLDAFAIDEFIQFLKYCPKVENLKLSITEVCIESNFRELDEAEIRQILTPDVKQVEFFEFNKEKPKLVIKRSVDVLEILFTWGNTTKFSHW